mmetsp:Transcript_11769/g.38764  ORF Transcript_11769/g.38764 Transcript_11769/m.38764 type:complete len:583 (-) Transcript_11769:279-2027(-)
MEASPREPVDCALDGEVVNGRDDCGIARRVAERDDLEVGVHLCDLAQPLHARAARVERVERHVSAVHQLVGRSLGERDREHRHRADVLAPERLVGRERVADGVPLGAERAGRHGDLEVHAAVELVGCARRRLAAEQHRQHRLVRLAQPKGGELVRRRVRCRLLLRRPVSHRLELASVRAHLLDDKPVLLGQQLRRHRRPHLELVESVEVDVRLDELVAVPPRLEPPDVQVVRPVRPQRRVERGDASRRSIGERESDVEVARPLLAVRGDDGGALALDDRKHLPLHEAEVVVVPEHAARRRDVHHADVCIAQLHKPLDEVRCAVGRVRVGVGVGVARLARTAHEQQHFLRTAHGRAGGGRLRRALLVEGAGPAQQQRADDGQDDRGDARLLQRLRRRLVVAGRSLGEAGPEDRRGRVILAALARARRRVGGVRGAAAAAVEPPERVGSPVVPRSPLEVEPLPWRLDRRPLHPSAAVDRVEAGAQGARRTGRSLSRVAVSDLRPVERGSDRLVSAAVGDEAYADGLRGPGRHATRLDRPQRLAELREVVDVPQDGGRDEVVLVEERTRLARHRLRAICRLSRRQ